MSDQDDLLEAARQPPPDVPDSPLHPRVLEVEEGDGFSLGLVLWRHPGVGAPDLLKRAIEASLLSELCRPADELVELPGRRLRSLRLVAFEEVIELNAMAQIFGFERDTQDDTWPTVMARIRGEASTLGRPVPDAPAATWRASATMPEHDDVLLSLESALCRGMKSRVFGERPGEMFACLNAALEGHDQQPLTPKVASIDVLEKLIGSDHVGALRWIPPMLFQSLCDAVAVVTSQELGRDVQWAMSEVGDDGLASPPLIRVREGSDWIHIPLGLHILRWCVMPLRPGEEPDPLSAWLVDQFARR